jgi:alpha-1,2-mannosyltransferase
VLAHHVPYQPWHNVFDLRIYHGAVDWWRDGRPLYSYLWGDSPYGFTYPPFAALVMLPMAGLSIHVVAVLRTAACALVVVAGTW